VQLYFHARMEVKTVDEPIYFEDEHTTSGLLEED